VAAIDDAPEKNQGECDGEEGPGGTPTLLHPLVGALAQWKRLVGRFLFFTEQIGLLHLASTRAFFEKHFPNSHQLSRRDSQGAATLHKHKQIEDFEESSLNLARIFLRRSGA
jgi:hypothetical protein